VAGGHVAMRAYGDDGGGCPGRAVEASRSPGSVPGERSTRWSWPRCGWPEDARRRVPPPGSRRAATTACVMAVLLMTACRPPGDVAPSPDSSSSVATTTQSATPERSEIPPLGVGDLDWTTATIAFPLDRFIMRSADVSVMWTAQSIALYQCVYGTQRVPMDVAIKVRHALAAAQPPRMRWLWGYWNAAYVVKSGLAADDVSFDMGFDPPPARAKECAESAEYLTLEPVYYGLFGSDPTLADAPNAGMDSFRLAIHDGRFAAIREARDQCITAAGYRVEEDSETGGVAIDSAWSVEYRLKAALAEAACDDGLGQRKGTRILQRDIRTSTSRTTKPNLWQRKQSATDDWRERIRFSLMQALSRT